MVSDKEKEMDPAFLVSISLLLSLLFTAFYFVRFKASDTRMTDLATEDVEDEQNREGNARRRANVANAAGQGAGGGGARRGGRPGPAELARFRRNGGAEDNLEDVLALEGAGPAHPRTNKEARELLRRARDAENEDAHRARDAAWEQERREKARREAERRKYGTEEGDRPVLLAEISEMDAVEVGPATFPRVQSVLERIFPASSSSSSPSSPKVHVEVLATYARLTTREVLSVLRRWPTGGFVDTLGYFHPAVDRAFVAGVARESEGRHSSEAQLQGGAGTILERVDDALRPPLATLTGGAKVGAKNGPAAGGA